MDVRGDAAMYRVYDTGNVIRLYRLVQTEKPTTNDFLSAIAQGRRVRNPLLTRIADGVSMYATPEQAREAAARAAERGVVLGPFLAAIDIPLDGTFRIERTVRSAGHFTVWGEASAMSTRIAHVVG